MGELLRQGLEEENHTVTWARDGIEGVHAAEGGNYDAIVTDVMMPGMDGIELVRRLRRGGRQTPVLILTARDSADDVVRGLDAGADDYLTSPFPSACCWPAYAPLPAAQSGRRYRSCK